MWDIDLHQYNTGSCCEPSKTKRHTSSTTKVTCFPPANSLLTAADFWSFKVLSVCFPPLNPVFTAAYFWNFRIKSFCFPVWTFVLTASDFWSLYATSQGSADNAHEARATQGSHWQAQVHHLGLRTCEWAQHLKPLPTTRTRTQSPVMWDIELHQCSTSRCCEPS